MIVFHSTKVTSDGSTFQLLSSQMSPGNRWRLEVMQAGLQESPARLIAAMSMSDLMELHGMLGAALVSAGVLGARQ